MLLEAGIQYVVSMIFGGHLGFMQIRRGCWDWKIGLSAFSDNLDPNEDKNEKQNQFG